MLHTFIVIILIIILIFVLLATAVFMGFAVSIFLGAPYVGTSSSIAASMLKAADADEKDTVLDIGCGLGNILQTALTDFHVRKVIGVDINPVILFFTKIRFRPWRKRAEFIRTGIKELPQLPEVSIVVVYLLKGLMNQLPDILPDRIQPEALLVSHGFTIDGIEPEQVVHTGRSKIYIYRVRDIQRTKNAM